jgi:hypothetical protein
MDKELTLKQQIVKAFVVLGIMFLAIYLGYKWRKKHQEDAITTTIYFNWMDPSLKIKPLCNIVLDGDSCDIYAAEYDKQTFIIIKPKCQCATASN